MNFHVKHNRTMTHINQLIQNINKKQITKNTNENAKPRACNDTFRFEVACIALNAKFRNKVFVIDFIFSTFWLCVCVLVFAEVRFEPPLSLRHQTRATELPIRKERSLERIVPRELGILDAKSLTTLTACSTLLYVSVDPSLYTVPAALSAKIFDLRGNSLNTSRPCVP